jgi:hypothetical protein
MRCEHLRHFAADVADPEREEETRQVALLRRLDVLQDLVREYFAHAFQRDELVLSEEVNIGWVLDEAAIQED